MAKLVINGCSTINLNLELPKKKKSHHVPQNGARKQVVTTMSSLLTILIYIKH